MSKEFNISAELDKQRVEKGFSELDARNISSWFLDVMPQMLRYFRDNLTSYPVVATGPSFNSKAIVLPGEKEPQEGFENWKKVIDRMIFLLDEMDIKKCSMKNPCEEEKNKAEEEFEKLYGLLGKDFEKVKGIKPEKDSLDRVYFISDDTDHPEWAELDAQYRYYEAVKDAYRDRCREEFFNLFSTWFWDLWV